MLDEDLRCIRCGGVLVPGSHWQLTTDGRPVCEQCVVKGSGYVIKPSGAYDDGR
jgi:hypothetical protein